MNEQNLLSLPQAAALRSVSKQAMLYAVKAGRLPAQRVGKLWIVTKEAVEALEIKKFKKNP